MPPPRRLQLHGPELREVIGNQQLREQREREEARTDDHQTRHRAALESQVERGAEALLGGFGDAHVRLHRDAHAHDAGGGARHRADHEARRHPATEDDQ
jgi:hypothetical protein